MKNDENFLKLKQKQKKRRQISTKIKCKFQCFKSPLVVICFIFLLIESFSLIYALLWAVMNSLKSINDFSENLFGFPRQIMFDNYAKVYNKLYYYVRNDAGYQKIYFPQLVLNTILYSVPTTIIYTFSMAMVAYVSVKYRFWFNKVINTIVMFVVVFPGVASLGSRLQFLHRIGFYDNYWALLYGLICFADYNFLIWAGVFKGIPDDYIEAAKIDGAGHYQIMFQIVFPMARVQFAILLVLGFIGRWNDYQTALTTLPSMPNLALALYQFRENTINAISWPTYRLAACLIVAVPCIILYIIVEPIMVGNLTAGGLKG